MNERDVIPALRWKPSRSSGKLSLWGSCHLLWSKLPPFKGFWTHASRFQEAESPASLPPSSRCSLSSHGPSFQGSEEVTSPCHFWSAGLCLALARQP